MRRSEDEGNEDLGPRLRLALSGALSGAGGAVRGLASAGFGQDLPVKGPAISFGKRERGLVLGSGNLTLRSD